MYLDQASISSQRAGNQSTDNWSALANVAIKSDARNPVTSSLLQPRANSVPVQTLSGRLKLFRHSGRQLRASTGIHQHLEELKRPTTLRYWPVQCHSATVRLPLLLHPATFKTSVLSVTFLFGRDTKTHSAIRGYRRRRHPLRRQRSDQTLAAYTFFLLLLLLCTLQSPRSLLSRSRFYPTHPVLPFSSNSSNVR